VKNIGKPCALVAHARFDEGGQVRACSLLYPLIFNSRTPLPGARKVYGQLLSRDFNPLDIPPITANGLTPLISLIAF
jgi:hypothetical protein